MRIDAPTLLHDVRYFAICYAIAVGAAFLPLEPVWPKWIVGIGLIAIYAWYVRAHFVADPDIEVEDLAPLRFHRSTRASARPDDTAPAHRLRPGCGGPRLHRRRGLLLRRRRRTGGRHLGVDELLLALVVAPIATELPEKFNSIIWVRQNKDTLSMGNITGAMVFQSTIPTFVALVFASSAWHIGEGLHGLRLGGHRLPVDRRDLHPTGSAGSLRGRNLLVGGAFYLVFLALVVVAGG